jgi:hypothetical protein
VLVREYTGHPRYNPVRQTMLIPNAEKAIIAPEKLRMYPG